MEAKNEKFYLGISLGFNSSACIMSDRRGLVAAVSQERMTGKKNTKEFPIDAINACIKIAQMEQQVFFPLEHRFVFDGLGISFYEQLTVEAIKKYLPDTVACQTPKSRPYEPITPFSLIQRILSQACAIRILCNNIKRIEHHQAHAMSALVFHGKPKRNAYFVTSDGFGDGLSGRIMDNNGEIVSSVRMLPSIGLIYQFTTGALGFKEHQHEGKITGLASYGEPRYLKEFKRIIDSEDFGIRLDNVNSVFLVNIPKDWYLGSPIEDFDLFHGLKNYVYSMVKTLLDEGATREDIACSVQTFTEEVIVGWITRNCNKKGKVDLYLAGGLFANVKLNQRIKDISFVDSIYVAPPMGDEGTCVGAAYEVMKNTIGERKIDKRGLFSGKQSAYLGTSHEVDMSKVIDIVNSLLIDASSYKLRWFDSEQKQTEYLAERLSKNRIVCLFRGSMEFGPRALCNRSIIYHCEDRSVNNWLNERLSRTEFMPFAPICKLEYAKEFFKNIKGALQTAQYMTVTFDCTEEFIKNYPAACHVDNTARPQFITNPDNGFAYKLLTEYEKVTGLKALINTSFNLHNYPIIESIETAIHSWTVSGLDILSIENLVIERV